MTQIELERVINSLLFLDREALQAKIKDPKTPMIEMIAASIMAQAAQKGDHQRLDFILQRMIGKVKDQLEVTTQAPHHSKMRAKNFKERHMSSRYDYVKYDDKACAAQAAFKAKFEQLEDALNEALPSTPGGRDAFGRAKALVLTKLEEAYMWVGKAIRDDQMARYNGPQEER